MSTFKPASGDLPADERPQLHRRVSVHELLSPVAAIASPRETQGLKVDDEETQDNNNDVPSTNSNSSNDDTTATETAELRQEIECLEEVIDRLEDEKNALKMRLNEIEYFQKFQVGHCKRWLQANFDFDRKDSPDLLAGIFEDYLMQNDSLEPLPHQMIVKNSAKGRMRREKLVQQRTYRRGVKRDTKPATDAPPLKRPGNNKTADGTTSDNTTSNGTPSISNTNTLNNNPWSIYNVFIPVDEMDRLFALEPWQSIPKNWPKVATASKTSAVQELLATQEAFLEENAWAIWERTHWFPIKQQNGRTEAEIRRLAQLHNRRKKRQMVLKSGLEEISSKLHKTPGVDRAVLRQSIFSADAVETLLKRPRLWIPREGEDLVAQLEQLDCEDPDRQNASRQAGQGSALSSVYASLLGVAGGSGARVMRRSTEQQQPAEEPSGLMQTYLRRYEALQQERLRSRRQRASEQFFSPSASAVGSDVEQRLGGGFEHAVGFSSNRYDHSVGQHAPEGVGNGAQAPQQEQQWSYAEYEHDREEGYRHYDGGDTFDFAPVADSLAYEPQHQEQQYNPFQDSLSEQQASYPTEAQTYGVSVASEEFVDAATYLEKNQLGGDDSFEEDIDHQAQWERQDESVLESESGRPSDFFEKRSRNMERVEFALNNETEHRDSVDDELHHQSEEETDYTDRTPYREPTRVQSDPLDTSLSFSDSVRRLVYFANELLLLEHSCLTDVFYVQNTAFSSGYDVHFDNARQAFTPNSLKHLQEKSRRRTPPLGVHEEEPPLEVAVQHENDAKNGTERPANHRLVVPTIEESPDELPESIQAMQRGPGIIVEALNEIDALISNPASHRPSAENGGRGPRGTTSVHDIVREYDMSLETGLPLSRTTDSWGDDPDEDLPLRQENVDSPPRSRENRPSATNEAYMHRRGEHPSELNTIRESSRFSSISSMDNTNQLYRINEECDTSISSARTGETLPSSRARHQVEASGDTERARFTPRQSLERGPPGVRGNSSPLARRNGSMQSSGLMDNHLEGSVTPRKMNGDDQFSDDIRKADNNVPAKYKLRGKAGTASPTKTHREEQWGTNGRSQRDPALTPKNEAKQTRPQDKTRADSSRQLFNDMEVASSLRNRDNGSQRILPHKSAKEENIEGLAINPIQLSRRCRRLLCTVGEIMTERIVFSNGSDSVGRICVSLLPLSTGCQQFSVSPAVLELAPRASSSFHVTFKARTAGVAAGIFQFRGVGVESLFSPYEVLIEASVRRNLELEEYDVSGKLARVGNNQRDRQVEELRRSKCINEVEIGPTFVKFERVKAKGGVKSISPSTLKITNNTEETQTFKINCSHENLKITPDNGFIPPASEATVTLLPLSRPFDQRRNEESIMSTRSVPSPENWTGSFTVAVGKVSREVSFVFSRDVIEALPPFDAIARSRHHISSQTDSFYYTKKRNRKGLYFHARAVECGSCNVGELHQVPVYICNGSSSPMTVFLQDLMDPFSCYYTTTTIEPRKFIEVPVTFTPKVAGKVSTSLFAYSVTDKAVVTLVARGI